MEDPQQQQEQREEERRRRRQREEEMERMLLEQEAAEENGDHEHHHHHHARDNHDDHDHDHDDMGQQEDEPLAPDGGAGAAYTAVIHPKTPKLSYSTVSFTAAATLIWYALRSRQQWYLALVFLGSSKYAYIILGNAIIATCMRVFDVFVNTFLNGLRLLEREGLSDFFRWNITETCLALTMFRSELTVESAVYFLFLVLGKCLHWVVEQRESHLRMTQDAVTACTTPGSILKGYPILHRPQLGLLGLLQVLLVLDIIAVVCCIQHVANHGPSVQLLFGFEAAILLVSAMSLLLLASLHILDGFLHYLHDTTHISISGWKDRKATLIFAMEVQAQGAKFVFYCTFFGIVFTYYGLPMNLFREVYVSFQQLRLRLTAFSKYRKLVKSMNRYPSPTNIPEDGEACIICRDDMVCSDSKQLPGCGHMFHTSCLREWLVQQQTCPTCRGDISVNEARAKAQAEAAARNDAEEAARNAALEMAQQEQDLQQQAANAHPPPSAPPAPASTVAPTTGNAPPQTTRMERDVVPTLGQEMPRNLVAATTAPETAAAAAASTTPPQVFPALYKVVGPVPAPVYTLEDQNNVSTATPTRFIAPGTAVLVLEMELQTIQDDLGLMMRIPHNGWIWENQLEYLTTVK